MASSKKKKKKSKKKSKRRNIIVLGMILVNKASRIKSKKDYDRSTEKEIISKELDL
jgi:hypothetical protein